MSKTINETVKVRFGMSSTRELEIEVEPGHNIANEFERPLVSEGDPNSMDPGYPRPSTRGRGREGGVRRDRVGTTTRCGVRLRAVLIKAVRTRAIGPEQGSGASSRPDAVATLGQPTLPEPTSVVFGVRHPRRRLPGSSPVRTGDTPPALRRQSRRPLTDGSCRWRDRSFRSGKNRSGVRVATGGQFTPIGDG